MEPFTVRVRHIRQLTLAAVEERRRSCHVCTEKVGARDASFPAEQQLTLSTSVLRPETRKNARDSRDETRENPLTVISV